MYLLLYKFIFIGSPLYFSWSSDYEYRLLSDPTDSLLLIDARESLFIKAYNGIPVSAIFYFGDQINFCFSSFLDPFLRTIFLFLIPAWF